MRQNRNQEDVRNRENRKSILEKGKEHTTPDDNCLKIKNKRLFRTLHDAHAYFRYGSNINCGFFFF